jgi:hypothetical protein
MAEAQGKSTLAPMVFWGHVLAIEINDFLPHGSGKPHNRSRVIPNILHLLDHIDKHRAEGNFFITPNLLNDFPEVVSLVSSRGHEIGLCCDSGSSQCLIEIIASREKMEKITNKAISGVMLKGEAKDGRPMLRALAEREFRYCLTEFPMAIRENTAIPIDIKYDNNQAISVFPPSAYNFSGVNLYFGKPGKIRLYPFWFIRRCIRQSARKLRPAVINFPLWEFDPHLPRKTLSPLQSIKSYGNLSLAEFKLTRMLLEFDFVRVPKIIETDEESAD